MKKGTLLLTATLIAPLLSSPATAQQLEVPRPSPFAKVTQTVGLTDITVDYSSPAVKGRKIWGGLVPYGEVWRAGANTATKITFSRDVTVGEHKVPAGSYAFFAIPTATSWTLVLSKEPNQPGAFAYKKEQDLLRLEVKPQPISSRERLAYLVSNFSDGAAQIDLEWEKVRVSLPVKLNTEAQVKANVTHFSEESWVPFNQAARWELEKKDYDAGIALIEKSIGLKQTWLNVWTKAQLLAGKGDVKSAYALAQKAKQIGEPLGPEFFLATDVNKALTDWKKRL